jgi:DNA replication protein DnaC
MDITTKTDTRKCERCGNQYEHEELFWDGKPIATSDRCDPCEEDHRAEYERNHRIKKAESEWNDAVPAIYRATDTKHPDYQAKIKYHKLAMQWAHGGVINEVEGKRLFLGLIGESGICKTRIVSQVIKVPIWRGQGVYWINSSQFQWACQHLHDDQERGKAAKVLKSCRGTSVLVLDDIGSLKATEVVSDNLYAILEHRTSCEKPMIWTSNETLDEMLPGNKISEKAKKRNISRLAGYSNIIEL